jgi:hypothetical protein
VTESSRNPAQGDGRPASGTETGHPVPGFPYRTRWQTGLWFDLFEMQVDLIERDVARAMAQDSVMVFQSLPLTGRGGGHYATNVEVAEHLARRLMEEWGHRFWVLNPARYQLESKEGTGLMHLHASRLSQERREAIDVDELFRRSPPHGGDYMRMWTRILVEDDMDHSGRRWDVLYFVGPHDVRSFFTEDGARTWTAGVEEYFARKQAMDRDFHDAFVPPFFDREGRRLTGTAEKEEWKRRRNAFFRYYTVRAGVNFSLGSHDEWNIWQGLNERRRAGDGIADQIAGYFDGRQLDPASFSARAAPGYEALADQRPSEEDEVDKAPTPERVRTDEALQS